MTIDWEAVRRGPTAVIVRDRLIPVDAATGVLWAEADVHLLSAKGALAWADRSDRPIGPHDQWVGANLLCNAAPTPFEIDCARAASVESFQKSLKFP